MTTERLFLFAHILQVSKWSLRNLILYTFLMILYMYITLGQGQKTPWGQTFDVNRKPLSLRLFVASFKPYMCVVATLVMWPRCPRQTFVPLTHGGSTWNLASIGPAVLEKKIFENGGRMDRWMDDDGWTTEHAHTISSLMSLKAQVS